MAEAGIVASAVVVPEPEPETTDQAERDAPANASPALKRRQSSASADGDSKRPRLSADESAATQDGSRPSRSPERTRRESNAAEPVERRRSGLEKERGRGRRLFGALLGTVAQSTSRTKRGADVEKRRAEIERKQQEKLKLQDAEYEARKREGYKVLMARRRRDQVVFEEQTMHLRHANMRAMAHFLKTKTQPALYYKPWELTAAEEDIIQDQIGDVEAQILDELDEWDKRHGRDRAAREAPPRPTVAGADESKEHETEGDTHQEPTPQQNGDSDDKATPVPADQVVTTSASAEENDDTAKGTEDGNGDEGADGKDHKEEEARDDMGRDDDGRDDDKGEMLISEEDTVMY